MKLNLRTRSVAAETTSTIKGVKWARVASASAATTVNGITIASGATKEFPYVGEQEYYDITVTAATGATATVEWLENAAV